MGLKTVLERCDYDLDKTFTEILDRSDPQLWSQQTMAGALADIISQRLDHLKSPSIASTDRTQKEMAFLHCEYATWSLLDGIQRSNSPLQKCSNIKDWISSIPEATDLPGFLKQDPIEDEIDAEVCAMFTLPIGTPTSPTTPNRKRGIHLDDDDDDDDYIQLTSSGDTQRRRITQDHHIKREKINEKLYSCLRTGDLDGAMRISAENDEPWGIILTKSYVERCKRIQLGERLELDPDDQRFWRSYCKGLLKKEELGPYGKAVYAILLGDIDNLLPVCETWEDAIWAYYNSQMEHTIDNMANATTIITDITILNTAHENIATRKDSNLPRKHPGHFFHLVQSHILKNDLARLYQLAYQCKKDGPYFKGFIIRDDAAMRHQLDRFMAAFVVYARQYLRSPKDLSSEQIIYRYAKRNQYPPTFYPKTLAFFASKLDHELEVDLFSEFLNGFDGDNHECKLLVEMGAQYNLDMKAILLRAYGHAMEQSSQNDSTEHYMDCDKDGSELFELDGQVPDDVAQYLRAQEWLLMDASLYGRAIAETNKMVRKCLFIRKVYLAERMIEAIPLAVVNHCTLQTQGGFRLPDYLVEFQDHSSLLECWRLYASWDTLLKEKPNATRDELETLKRTLAWKNDLVERTEKLEARLRGLLTSSWLKDGNRFATGHNDELRQIYIVEAVIRLHRIQYMTKDIDTSPYTAKRDTLISLVASEKYGIYKDIVACGKMTIVFETLNEQ